MMITISTRKRGDTLTVLLEGKLNRMTADTLEERLDSEMRGVKKLIFDFEKLIFISSAGLRVLVKLRQKVGARENMEIRNVQEEVMKIFTVTGLAEYLNIHPIQE